MPDYLNKNLLIPDFGTKGNQGILLESGWPGGDVRMQNGTPPFFEPGTNGPPSPQSPRGMQQPFSDVGPDISKLALGDESKMPKNVPGISEDDDITKIVMKLYPQNHEVSDKFNEIWSQMPQRQKPSVLRRIVASMVGAGQGVKAADEVVNAPYNQAMGDWETKLKMLQPALTDERFQNTNARQMAATAGTQSIQNKRADIAAMQADTAKKKADAYVALQTWKMEHPDWEVLKTEGGNYTFWNPKTRQAVDSGIKTGTLDPAEELKMRIQAMKDVAAIPRTVITSGTTTTISPDDVDKETPNEEKVRRYNRAQQIFNTRPEFQKYIKLGELGTNEFTIEDAPPEIKSLIEGLIYTNPKDIPLDGPEKKQTITTRESTSTTQRGTPNAANPVEPKKGDKVGGNPAAEALAQDQDKRARAIKILQDNKKVVNEQTIKAVMDRMK